MLWVLLAGTLSLIISGLAVVYLMARIPMEARQYAEQVAESFRQQLNFTPEVRVDGLVLVHGSDPTLEIITSRSSLTAHYKWSHTFLYSTKSLEMSAPFTAIYGFTIDQPFRIRIEPQTRAVDLDVPQTQLLALEMGDVDIHTDSDGLWNQLTAEDREEALRQLRSRAESRAKSLGEINSAKRRTEEVLTSVLSKVEDDQNE